MMLGATALMALGGFAKPRSFLYLAPVFAVVLALFLDRRIRHGNAGFAVAMAGLLVATSLGAIANIKDGERPFKRNSVIPYQSIVDFIQLNGTGAVLVISTDPVMPWILKHRQSRGELCVSFLLTDKSCIAAARRYESIFLITGYSDRSANAGFMRFFNSVLTEVTAERRKIATIHVGIDRDAALKSRLTGVPLSEEILTVDLYR